MTGGEIPGFCSKTSTETGNECFLLRAGSEGLDLECVERAEASEQLILSGETMVDSAAELVNVPLQCFDGGQVLELRGGRGTRNILQKRGCDGIDPGRRNPVVRERCANPRRWNGRGIANLRETRKVSCSHGVIRN